MSDNPGIVDDTSDGDLGANPRDPEYGSLAESQAEQGRRDSAGDLADADINSSAADGGAAAGAGSDAERGDGDHAATPGEPERGAAV